MSQERQRAEEKDEATQGEKRGWKGVEVKTERKARKRDRLAAPPLFPVSSGPCLDKEYNDKVQKSGKSRNVPRCSSAEIC